MSKTTAGVLTLGPTEGGSVSVVGDTYRILVSGARTGGAFAIIDMLIPPNGGPGPHSHAALHESFYVVEGEVVVKTKDLAYTAVKGSLVSIPVGGVVHDFKNLTNSTAHLLCTVVPAGLDAFFLEIGQPVPPGTFLPAAPMSQTELARLTAIAEKYGQKLFPPDYLD